MKITIHKDQLIGPLTPVFNVIDKRASMPILSHIYIEAGEQITLTATDLEIQIKAQIDIQADQHGTACLPAEKFFNIIKSLPPDAKIKISTTDEKTIITAGRSRFTLNGLPSSNYPEFLCQTEHQITLPEAVLKKSLEKTQFCMAVLDARYYLNGLLINIADRQYQTVASDGHRLAFFKSDIDSDIQTRIILPSKSVQQLFKLIDTSDNLITLQFSRTHCIVQCQNIEFSSKLIDANYPDFSKVFAKDFHPEIQIDTDQLKTALQRAAILSNQQLRGLRLSLDQSELTIRSNNLEADEAEEPLEIDGFNSQLDICFKSNYLIDALSHIDSIKANLKIASDESTCLVQDTLDDSFEFIVMPMRL